MAKVFNKNISILNIGGEMCKLYNNVQNEKDLMNAFTLFEKLFKYQKNLIETKKTLFQTYLFDQEKVNKNSVEALNRMQQNHEDSENKEFFRVRAKANNLDEINKEYNTVIDEINAKIEVIKKEIDEILVEKKKYEDELIKIDLSSKTVDPLYLKETEVLNDLESKLAEITEKEREAILKQVTNIEVNRDSNFERCLADLKKEGIIIPDEDKKDFKLAFINFSKNFHQYKLFREDIQKRSNDIKIEYEQLLEQLTQFNSIIQNFRVISNSENLKNKIWELIKYNHNLENPNDENSNLNDIEYLKKILFIKLDLKDDVNDRDVRDIKKALDLIKKNVRGENELVSKLEVNPKYIEKFVEDIIDGFKTRIKDKKTELDELEKNSDKNAEIIKTIESQINDFKMEIDNYKDNKREINNILEALDGIRKAVKEKYLKSRVLGDLKSMIKLIIEVYIPNINIMRIEYTKNSN